MPKILVSLGSNPNIAYLKTAICYRPKELDNVSIRSPNSEPSLSSGANPPPGINTDDKMRKIYQIHYQSVGFINIRIICINVSRWTEVTSNECHVQKLLHTYFTFENVFNTFLHKNFLLENIMARCEQYCLSLLVNIFSAMPVYIYVMRALNIKILDLILISPSSCMVIIVCLSARTSEIHMYLRYRFLSKARRL